MSGFHEQSASGKLSMSSFDLTPTERSRLAWSEYLLDTGRQCDRFVTTTSGADPSQKAAARIQAWVRGRKGRRLSAMRSEQARQSWARHYVASGEVAHALALGWDEKSEAEYQAASKLQAACRGGLVRNGLFGSIRSTETLLVACWPVRAGCEPAVHHALVERAAHLRAEIPLAESLVASLADPATAVIAGRTPSLDKGTGAICHVTICLMAGVRDKLSTRADKDEWSIQRVVDTVQGWLATLITSAGPIVLIRGFSISHERLGPALSHLRLLLIKGPQHGCISEERQRWRTRCSKLFNEVALLNGVSWIRAIATQDIVLQPSCSKSTIDLHLNLKGTRTIDLALGVLMIVGFDDECSSHTFDLHATPDSQSAVAARLLHVRAMANNHCNAAASVGVSADDGRITDDTEPPPALKLSSKVVLARDDYGEIPSVEVAQRAAAAAAAATATAASSAQVAATVREKAEKLQVEEERATAIRAAAFRVEAEGAASSVIELLLDRIQSHKGSCFPSEEELMARRQQTIRATAIASLRGVLYKQSSRVSWYHRRYFFAVDSPAGILLHYCSVGDATGQDDDDHLTTPSCIPSTNLSLGDASRPSMLNITNARQAIPLESVRSFAVTSDVRYEFQLVSTHRRRPLRFRAPTRSALDRWIRCLHVLLSEVRSWRHRAFSPT